MRSLMRGSLMCCSFVVVEAAGHEEGPRARTRDGGLAGSDGT